MAVTVPSLDGPQVRSAPLGAPQVRTVGPDQSGFQLQQTATRAASALAQQSMEQANTAALLKAEQELSQSKLDMMFSEGGVYSKKGQQALDITNQTLPQFDKAYEQISNSLTNQAQRDQFARIYQHQRGQMDSELNRYEFGERNVYYDQVDAANIETSVNGAMAYASDPKQVQYYTNKGDYVIAQQGQRKGLPPQAIELELQKFRSGVTSGVINKLATTDPIRAQEYYAANYAQLTPDAQAKMQKLLGTSVRKQMAAHIAQSVYTDGTPGDNSLIPYIIQQESGGDPTAVSPKGAQGLMQLMPDTAKEMAQELGVPYDEARLKRDPNYNMALGTRYLNKMLGRYSNNKALALAAYNAGPGAVDEWLKTNGDPRTGEVSTEDWVQKIPYKETRNYTETIIGKYANGSGEPASVKYANGRKAAETLQDPELKALVMDNLDQLKKTSEAELTAKYDQAAQYVNNKGFQSIPAELVNQLPAEELIKLRRLDAQVQKGEAQPTDQDKYREFLTMPAEKLASLSLSKDIAPYLSTTDLKSFTNIYQSAKNGDGTPQQIQKAKENVVETTMAMAGILVGKSKDALNPKNLEKQQLFRSGLQTRIDSFKIKEGREPDVNEVESLAQQLLLNVKLSGGGIFGGTSNEALWEIKPEELANAYLDKGDLEIDKIPPAERRQIVMEMRANGETPDEAGIIANYINRISGQGVKVK